MKQPINEISCCNCGTCQAYIARMEERIARLEEVMKPVSTDIVYAGDADRAEYERFMEDEKDMQALDDAYEQQHRDRLHKWYDAAQQDWCTGSPTCQCSRCRLTEHNSNEAPEDQIVDRPNMLAQEGLPAEHDFFEPRVSPYAGYLDDSDGMSTFYGGVES